MKSIKQNPKDVKTTTDQPRIKVPIPFHQVPNSIFEFGFTSNQLLVLHYLYRCGNQGAPVYPSHNKIAEKCGISKRSAINALAALYNFKHEGQPILRRSWQMKKQGGNTSNIYTLCLPILFEKEESGVQEVHPRGAGGAPYKEPSINNHPSTTQETKGKKLTFNEFVETLRVKPEYFDINISLELEKFNLYHSENDNQVKSPKTAFVNWLNTAVDYHLAHKVKPKVNGKKKTKVIQSVPLDDATSRLQRSITMGLGG